MWNTRYPSARDLALDLLPPLVARGVARHVMPAMRALCGRTTVHRVSRLDELDDWLRRADEAAAVSDDELRRVLGMFELVVDTRMPRDPFSDEYRAVQMGLYRQVSGRTTYVASESEQTAFDLADAVDRPYPFFTNSTATVGEQLMRQGQLIRALRLNPGARVVEFGAGWGNLTLELAQTGLAVTAVDISPKLTQLIARRANRLGLTVTTTTADMLDYRAPEPFDAAVFFESFHHCADHVQMLGNLLHIVRSDGFVAFGSEPIGHMPYPWGIRLDGMSLWSMRRFGWLENGFTAHHFNAALARTGWKGEFLFGTDIATSVAIARRATSSMLRQRSYPR